MIQVNPIIYIISFFQRFTLGIYRVYAISIFVLREQFLENDLARRSSVRLNRQKKCQLYSQVKYWILNGNKNSAKILTKLKI